MNRILIVVFAAFLSLTALTTSCDKVDEPYMNTGGGGHVGDTVRKVLLEDYTGHLCVNCPAAHKVIEGLQLVYPKRIVPVVIHTGFFARPIAAPYDYDFRTADGDAIATEFGAITAPLPKGVVNRINKGGYLINPAAYATAVSLVLDSLPEMPDIFIEIDPSFNSNDSTISVDVKMTSLVNMPDGKYNLSVVIVESEIVEAQKNTTPEINNGKDILDYNHKDVLRGAINTSWGEEFANAALSPNQTFTKSYSNYKIGSDWNPDNLKIVAFVYYADGPNDKVVIQVDEVHLK